MRWNAGWLCIGVLMACLAGCGGAGTADQEFGDSPAAEVRRFAKAMREQSPAQGGAAAPPSFNVDTEALFDWAEWQYPALFPKGPATQTVLHSGVSYKVRAYPNGSYLGHSAHGVFAQGPFNGDKIVRYGYLEDFAPLVRNDACRIRAEQCSPPSIGSHPLNLHTEPGGSASFAVVATSALPLEIQWQASLDGGVTYADVPGATGPNWTFRAESGDDGKRVRARVSTGDGVATSDAAWLMVRPALAPSYFPGLPGSRWVYRRSDGADPDTVRVAGSHPVDGGQTGTVFETTDGKDRSVWRDVYVTSPEGVRQYSPDAADAFMRAVDGLPLMRFPVVVGESSLLLDTTVDSGIDIDDDGQNDLLRIVASLTVVGTEAVSTPAARFDRALHQRHEVVSTFMSSSGLGSVDVRGVADVWYVAGVGQVKWTIRQSAPGLNEVLTYEVEAFAVGSMQSDVLPPRIQSRSPEGAFLRPARTVSVVFDDRIDPASVGPDSLVVTDAQGRRVAGTLRVSRNTLTLDPPSDWVDGVYTVSLAAGLRDFSGNVQSTGALWSFTADAVRPQVLSVLPAADARNVPLNSTVEITFSELPARSTLTSGRAYIYRESNSSANQSLPATLSIRGNTLVITPQARLQPGSNYSVVVSELADAAGNSVPFTTWRFRTVDGWFAPQASLGGSLTFVGQVAVSDINADTRPDVLLSSSGGPSLASGTFVRYGRADGTLAEPVRVPGTASCARFLSVADVNGDGRPDLLSGDDACRPVVLEQSASGSFVPGAPLAASSVMRAQFADLGDKGRPVILVTSSAGISIWHRSDAG